jgi:PAS domain S-box-containing protein
LAKPKADFERDDAAWTDAGLRDGVNDFWREYERCCRQVNTSVFESLVNRPQPGSGDSLDPLPVQRADWENALRSAQRGDWRHYSAWLRRHGARYGELGLGLHASGLVMRELGLQLLPSLVAAYGAQPTRLAAAVQAMNDFTHHGVRVIAEAYLERKESELQAREDDLSTTLDSIGDAVVVTDADGRVVRMNPVAERLTGFGIADCRGGPLADVFRIEHEATGDVVESPVRRVLQEGVVVGLANHTVLVARDGTRRPIADSGAPVRNADGDIRGIVLVFRDVTEERRAEETLRHWERVFQHATWGVALADVKEVRFRAVNPAYAAMHGYTVEELVGAPVSTLWAPSTKADMERHAHETRDHGHLVAETTHVRKDGTTLPVEVVAATIKDASGKVAWFVANVQDISERKRLQQSRFRAVELEARNTRIEEANRMKSEFLANMSHELRTPLNSIIGFTELLHDEQVGAVSAKQKEFLDDILSGGRHLLRLINDVLDLAKVEAGKMEFRPEPVDLGRLVATVVQSLRAPAIEKHLNVVVAIDPSLSRVVLDPGRFKQVLYNYLSNALKFTPDGGRVAIRLTPEADDRFVLEVEDSGPGIPAEQVPRLFVAFQQLESATTKRVGGTGLGLALTRRLAEAQGGTVGIRPAEGGGSVFFAVLPQRHVGPTQPFERRTSGPSLARVLVVEPEQTSREAMAGALMDAGYDVEAASSLARAARPVRERAHDAIVLDLEEDHADVRAYLQLVPRTDGDKQISLVGVGPLASRGSLPVAEVVSRPVAAETLLAALGRAGCPSPGSRAVLVVDDDASSLRLMEATLANLGYAAVCCSDAHEALRVLQRLRPAAVIVDIIMPDLDGLAFLARFRASERNRSVPVMFWTVKDLTAEERSSLRSSVDLVVQKGIGDGSRLSAALQEFLPASQQRREG